jgi:hypothetical protein
MAIASVRAQAAQKPVSEQTLGFILRGNELLLKFGVRGVGKDKWNGLGGKLRLNETRDACLFREVNEEGGGRFNLTSANYHGAMTYIDESPVIRKVHIYSSRDFVGEAKSTPEGEVKWFNIRRLPKEQMFGDLFLWFKSVLEEKTFNGVVVRESPLNKVPVPNVVGPTVSVMGRLGRQIPSERGDGIQRPQGRAWVIGSPVVSQEQEPGYLKKIVSKLVIWR